MKSKYQSTAGMSLFRWVDKRSDRFLAWRQAPQQGAFFRWRKHAPGRDLIECAQAAEAISRRLVDQADAHAGRGDFVLHFRLRVYAASFAASARATRDTGARPRQSEINFPAARSAVMSTPVSRPRPSSKYKRSSLATLPVAPL